MRWSGQQVLADDEQAGDVGRGGAVGEAGEVGGPAQRGLPGLAGLLRSVRTPEFAGTVFHEVEAKSVLNRVPGSSPVPFRWTVNPYRGCSHGCVYCLVGSTRILLPDGRTQPIERLRVGDVVLGTERVAGVRRYVPTRVLAHWSTTKAAYAVSLVDGTELRASGEHRFLTDEGWRHVGAGWCRAGRRPHLRPGSVLLGPGGFGPERPRPQTPGYRQGYLCGLVRGDGPGFPSEHLTLEALGRAHHLLAEARPVPVLVGAETGRIARVAMPPVSDVAGWPTQAGDEWCAGFLAGVIDARGVVRHGELRVGHAEEAVVGRIAGALHRLGFGFAVASGPDGMRDVRLLGGPGALQRLLARTRPAVTRRLDGGAVDAAPGLTVVAVRELGETLPMYDITTGSGDFVAEGVVSHNCFARQTHTYLDLDAGHDFDSQIVVKVNVAQVLSRELRSARWEREPVAMGTNTDPYQRAEGRYRLMPGVITELARSGTPFSLLTKGTVLARDLPELVAAAKDVPVSLGVSIALVDRGLQAGLEPGTPSPAARLDLVERITAAGLRCGVLVAPVLPLLTDSIEALDTLLARIAAAGASGASVMALHLRPGTREWFLRWLEGAHPELVEPYAQLYRRGAYVDPAYRRRLAALVSPLLRRHGLADAVPLRHGADVPTVRGRPPPAGSSSGSASAVPTAPPPAEQLMLL